MSRRSPHRGGFTLTELLVATMLLTIVMTAVYTLFFTVIQSWRSIENDRGFPRKARHVFAMFEREYNNLFTPASHLLAGTPDSITLFVVAPPMFATGDTTGPQLLRVRYRYNATEGTLEREEARVEGPLPPSGLDPAALERAHIPTSRPETTVIARGLTAFQFAYVWMPRPEGAYWRNAPVPIAPLVARYHERSWGLPQALDIRLRYADGDAAYSANRRLRTQTFNQRRERYQLVNILGDAL